jgi:hypothetical protein
VFAPVKPYLAALGEIPFARAWRDHSHGEQDARVNGMVIFVGTVVVAVVAIILVRRRRGG